jgi:prepilin signal peptidase PulO-like enzyme (type II secretory pathway)
VFFFVSLVRRRSWVVLSPLFAIVALFVTIVWTIGGMRWQALLSSVVGLGLGGGLIWGVRLGASLALRVEAMGFGDVTLMAMIGAFLGWQPAVLVVFLAPLSAVAIAICQRIMAGDREIPFGPYLCLATVLVIVYWDRLWTGWAQPVFELGGLIMATLALCLVLMAIMLWGWRLFRERVLKLHY